MDKKPNQPQNTESQKKFVGKSDKILDHAFKMEKLSNTPELPKASENTKPNRFSSLDGRDIVVIDPSDIPDMQQEANVIVVDNPRDHDVDLVELLGSNWPRNVGGESILNIIQTHQQQQQKQQSAKAATINTNHNSDGTATQGKMNRKKNPKNNSQFSAQHSSAGRSRQQTSENAEKALRRLDDTEARVKPTPPTKKDSENVPEPNMQNVPETALGVGSMVEVLVPQVPQDLFGVIRWIGVPPGGSRIMVGVELEDEVGEKELLTTDGTFNHTRLFNCPDGRALLVTPDRCTIDRRFIDVDGENARVVEQSSAEEFGHVDCPSVPGAVPPLKELGNVCGKFKGIQGHHNSCYLDATLFSMFAFTPVFDSLLFRPPDIGDIPHYTEVQTVLREEIVNPLRKRGFVRADRVMKLRKLLDKLSSVSGLTSEEKDPEEFLHSLLAQILRAEPYLKLSSGQDTYFYQLFVEKDDNLSFPTVQQLFEQSFHSSNIKLREVPSCLIIQMPRFGKTYKLYPRILPSQVLDVTDVIEDSPRQCSVCGKLAEFECQECFGQLQRGDGLESTVFCKKCLDTVHMHAKRVNHKPTALRVPQDFRIMAEHMGVPRLYMELFAVVCIETSHYVAFVKAGAGPDSPWCFFDSMADRKGEENGYNIPEMVTVANMPLWLSEEGARAMNESATNDKMYPEHAKRLFCDAYMCMYQSIDVMMYR